MEGEWGFNVSATLGGTAIILTNQGTGVHTFQAVESITLPLGNVSNLTFTTPLSSGNPSATIASYTLPNGTVESTVWLLPTGIYDMIDSNGNNIAAHLHWLRVRLISLPQYHSMQLETLR